MVASKEKAQKTCNVVENNRIAPLRKYINWKTERSEEVSVLGRAFVISSVSLNDEYGQPNVCHDLLHACSYTE